MSNLFYTQVPFIGGHSHFSNDAIEAFPDLHAHGTFEERQKQIKEEITYQLLTTKPEDARTCTFALTQMWTLGNVSNSKTVRESNSALATRLLESALSMLPRDSDIANIEGIDLFTMNTNYSILICLPIGLVISLFYWILQYMIRNLQKG